MMYLRLLFILSFIVVLENILYMFLFIETVVRFKVFIKPPEKWGRLLLNSGRTVGNKIDIVLWTLMTMACINVNMQWNNTILWLKIGVMILLIISLLLPKRIYENGIRDRIKFEPWSELDTVTFHKKDRVLFLLKNPNVRRKINFVLNPGDELPAFIATMVNNDMEAGKEKGL